MKETRGGASTGGGDGNNSNTSNHQAAEDASERLYKNSEQSTQQRFQAIMEIQGKEKQLREQDCTFKPQLITKNTPVHQAVQSKFTLPQTPRSEGVPFEMKNCTFTPKVRR